MSDWPQPILTDAQVDRLGAEIGHRIGLRIEAAIGQLAFRPSATGSSGLDKIAETLGKAIGRELARREPGGP